MALNIDHLPINIATGPHEYGLFNIANGVSTITMRLARCTTATPTIWPSETTKAEVVADVTFDNGQSFVFSGSWGSEGGILAGRNGEIPESLAPFPLPAGVGRKLRVSVNVVGGPLVSVQTVETT